MITFILYASDIFCESTTTVFLNVRIEITSKTKSNISHALHPSYVLNEFETHFDSTKVNFILITQLNLSQM